MRKITLLSGLLSIALLWTTTVSAQYKTGNTGFARDEDLIRKMEDQWLKAIREKQTADLQKILDDSYKIVDSNGEVLSKAQEIARLESDSFKIDSISVQDLYVRVYVGGAVVTGQAVLKAKMKDTDISGTYYFTDVFESGTGTWKAVYTQLTKVAEKEK